MGLIVERRGERQHFDERVLYASIYHVFRLEGRNETEAENRAAVITEEVKDWIRQEKEKCVTAEELRHKALARIEERDEAVAETYREECDVDEF
ncbi:MAG: hypothetical protein SVU32_02100 [Candidatus Nanohaloarchaea archaeon]|nr:hypothetical protein [Candidatus Nanohaloarchaea archaeon]